jgi:hypothetical protein
MFWKSIFVIDVEAILSPAGSICMQINSGVELRIQRQSTNYIVSISALLRNHVSLVYAKKVPDNRKASG